MWLFNLNAVFPDEHILPGAPPVIHTPVLAEYSGEQLVVFGEGGASWLESVLGFPLSALPRDTRAWGSRGPEIPRRFVLSDITSTEEMAMPDEFLPNRASTGPTR